MYEITKILVEFNNKVDALSMLQTSWLSIIISKNTKLQCPEAYRKRAALLTIFTEQFPFCVHEGPATQRRSLTLNCTEHIPFSCLCSDCSFTQNALHLDLHSPSSAPSVSNSNVTFSERSLQKALHRVLSSLLSRVFYNVL